MTILTYLAAYIVLIFLMIRTIRYLRLRSRREPIGKCKVAKGGKLVGFDKPEIILDDYEKEIS